MRIINSTLGSVPLLAGLILLWSCEADLKVKTNADTIDCAVLIDDTYCIKVRNGQINSVKDLAIVQDKILTGESGFNLNWQLPETAKGILATKIMLASDAACTQELKSVEIDIKQEVYTFTDIKDGVYYGCVFAKARAAGLLGANNNGIRIVVETAPPKIESQLEVFYGNGRTLDQMPSIRSISTSTYTLTKTSGPGELTFSKAADGTPIIKASMDGSYTLDMTAANEVGGTSTKTFTLVYDSVPPVVKELLPISSSANSMAVTAESFEELEFYRWEIIRAPSGAAPELKDANSATAELSLPSIGIYELKVSVSDRAGNIGSTKVFITKEAAQVLIDTTAPTGTITLAESTAGYAKVRAPAITLSASADTAQYQLCLNAATAGNDCSSVARAWASYTTSPAAYDFGSDGAKTLYVQFKDNAGNIGATASQSSLVIDTTPPDNFVITAPTTPSATLTPTVSWGAATGATHFDLMIAAAGDCSSPIQTHFGLSTTSQALTSLSDGTYYACVVARDAALNERTATNSGYAFVVDTIAPVLALGPRRVAANSFTLRPVVIEAGPLSYAWSRVSGPGSVSFGSPMAKDTLITASTEGDYVLRLTATDQVGLSAQADVMVTWDYSRLVVPARTHTCAIKAGGQLSCWGRNTQGETGNGDLLMQTSPQVVSFGPNRSVLSVAPLAFQTCAILDDGSVRCWGIGGSVQSLGTGYGDSVLRLTPTEEPVDLGEGRTAVALASAFEHVCAILDDGGVKCWGNNNSGQLGYGDTISRSATQATPLSLGIGRQAVEISLGENLSCIRLDDGTVKCFGANAFGQTGNGGTTNISAPPVAPISFPGGLTAKHLAVGRTHVCAILSNDTIACWGRNQGGQLGDRSTTNRTSPVLVAAFTGTPRRLALGDSYSCALRVDGTVSCWGNNPSVNGAGRNSPPPTCTDGISRTLTACNAASETWSSHLNDCSNRVSTSASACTASGGSWGSCSDFIKVSSGTCTGTWDPSKFAYCSKSDGTQNATQYCTSSGGTMLGDGYCSDSAYFSRASCLAASKSWHIARDPGPNLAFGNGRSAVALRAANFGSFSCAVLDNFDVTCWGDNQYGQLGYGDAYISTEFSNVDLGGGQVAQSVTLSASHTCALTGSGLVKCWGDNTYGKLGTGGFNQTLAPSTVALASPATQVSSLTDHTCAVLSNGGIQCWGLNSSGRLGGGILTVAESPLPLSVIGLGGNAVEVATGADFTCARLVDGGVKCWGNPANGRLGIGTAAGATACSDGLQATSTSCTTAGGTWNGHLYHDCSNGLSTSALACQAVSNGTWAHCSDGTSSTSGLCASASSIWNATLYNYCTNSSVTTTASAFCASRGGSQGAYGYCSDPSYKNRSDCLNASRNWHVATLPGAAVDLGGVAANQIAAGDNAACALLQGGGVRCWGANTNTQIGVGDTESSNNYLAPAAALDFAGNSVKALKGNTCAILEDDSLRCWGRNDFGQTGNAASATSFAAPSVTQVDFGAGRMVRDMASTRTGMGCAILDDSTLRCFGNTGINFAPGITTFDLTTHLSTGLNLGTSATPSSVAVALNVMCLTFANGSLRCGGQHTSGQPGQGLPVFRWLPPETAVLNVGAP